MACINRLSNLGLSPYQYLASSRKEKTFGASFCKTSLAIALLVPGILVALGCSLANVLLSPCLKTKTLSHQPSKPNSSTISDASPKVLKRGFKEESTSSRRKSVDLSDASSGENSQRVGKEPILIEELPSPLHVDPMESLEEKESSDSESFEEVVDHIVQEAVSKTVFQIAQQEEFRALGLKLQAEHSEVCRKGNQLFFLEGKGYYEALPGEIFKSLGEVGPCSRDLDGALRHPIYEHNANKSMNIEYWEHFQSVCKDTTKFLDAYEKIFDLYKFDPIARMKFQRWHERLCMTTIDIWTHAKSITQLLGQEKMEKLADRILVRWQALSAKKIGVSAEAPASDKKHEDFKALASPRESMDLPVPPQNFSREGSEGVAKGKEPILIEEPQSPLRLDARELLEEKVDRMEQEEAFEVLNRKIVSEFAGIEEGFIRLCAHVRKLCQFLPKEKAEEVVLLLPDMDGALRQAICSYNRDRKIREENWEYFQNVSESTRLFLDVYEKILDDCPPDLVEEFQRKHEELCEINIDIWTHAKKITQLMSQAEMEKLVDQILVRWQALSAKKIAILAEAPAADQ